MVKKQKDKYEENACEFKNETQCEEDLDEEGLEVEDAETEHFDEKEEDAWE